MKKTIILAAALVAMTACNKSLIENANPEENYGFIDFGVTADTEMVVTKGEGDTQTETPDLSGYNVTLKQGDAVKWTKEYSAITEADLKQPAGSYTLYVENLTEAETYAIPEESDFTVGKVRVADVEDVTVTAGISSQVDLICTPQNSMVSFMYTQDFDTVFDNPNVTVAAPAIKVGEVDLVAARSVPMTVGTEHTESNAAYFEAAKLIWTLEANLGGQTKTYTKEFTTTKAKWTQVTFTTGSTDGQIKVTISVDGKITEEEALTATIDPISGNVEQNQNK